MITLLMENDQLIIRSNPGDLASRHKSQLDFWKFETTVDSETYQSPPRVTNSLVSKITKYFEKQNLNYEVDSNVQQLLDRLQQSSSELSSALNQGTKLKAGSLEDTESDNFWEFLQTNIARTLKPHQFKAALHLLTVKNGANFSVPGSGKTTVVLSVFHYLRNLDQVDALFVVGPLACFGPWQDEYFDTIGKAPKIEIAAGGDINKRHTKYQVNRNTVPDLFLTSFQTLQRDFEQVQFLIRHQNVRFFLVIDEAHYVKQIGGASASAVLEIAEGTARRCILTGTPFPKSYADGFNLFDILWPNSPPISQRDKIQISSETEKGNLVRARDILKHSVEALFYRVRKSDLNLAKQEFLEPVMIEMKKYEREAYDIVLGTIWRASESDYNRDFDLVMKLRRGRIMRLRQCTSYTRLLSTAVEDYDEEFFNKNTSFQSILGDYDQLETPAKLDTLMDILDNLRAQNEKVVIWTNFIETLKLIDRTVRKSGSATRMIYGGTPLENTTYEDQYTRVQAVRDFNNPDSGVDVLIANPAACSESISLHKYCSNAIYYDLSYNCAQYLQSLDRIHRVGGSENKRSYYHFLQYEDTIDPDILDNVRQKAARMSEIIDSDYPIYSLDMFGEDEESNDDDELNAYERLTRQHN